MSAIGVYIGYAFSPHQFVFNTSILYAMLAVVCISGGGQAINDYFDAEVDKKKKSSRPIPSERITKENVLVYALLLFGLGILLSSFLSEIAFQIAAFFSALLILYSWGMKRMKFFGNIIVSLGVAFTYIFGASVNQITPLVLMIATAALLANWAREIIKDVEDAHVDKGEKQSLPHMVSKNAIHGIILGLLLGAILVSYLPLIYANASAYYGFLVTVSNAVFILAGTRLSKGNPAQSSSFMKKGMLIGLLAQLSILF